MLDWILLSIGIIGFGLASYWDLRYTEFPDWLPYVIIICTLVTRGIFALVYNNFSLLFDSILVGICFLGFGLFLYRLKQWGDGDAWLLGALGFLFPNKIAFPILISSVASMTVFPFPLIMLFNFFFIALLYLIIYSLILGFKTPSIGKLFFKSLKKDIKNLGLVIIIFSIACLGLWFYLYYFYFIPLPQLTHILLFPVLLVFILLFVHYGKVIETNLFKKHIPVKNLKVGDVLIHGKWRGLTEKEVTKLKKKGGKIWIKEGVRFAPVFLITLIITLFYGSLTWLFI